MNLSSDQEFGAMRAAYAATGGTACGDDVAQLMQDHQSGNCASLARLIVSGAVFGFEWHQTFWIPMFQFELRDLSVMPGPQQVLAELATEFDGWTLAVWFSQPNTGLNGSRPVDLLDSDLPPSLKQRALTGAAPRGEALRPIASPGCGGASIHRPFGHGAPDGLNRSGNLSSHRFAVCARALDLRWSARQRRVRAGRSASLRRSARATKGPLRGPAPTALRCSVSRPRRRTRYAHCVRLRSNSGDESVLERAARGAAILPRIKAEEARSDLPARTFVETFVVFDVGANTLASQVRALAVRGKTPNGGSAAGGIRQGRFLGRRGAQD